MRCAHGMLTACMHVGPPFCLRVASWSLQGIRPHVAGIQDCRAPWCMQYHAGLPWPGQMRGLGCPGRAGTCRQMCCLSQGKHLIARRRSSVERAGLMGLYAFWACTVRHGCLHQH